MPLFILFCIGFSSLWHRATKYISNPIVSSILPSIFNRLLPLICNNHVLPSTLDPSFRLGKKRDHVLFLFVLLAKPLKALENWCLNLVYTLQKRGSASSFQAQSTRDRCSSSSTDYTHILFLPQTKGLPCPELLILIYNVH